MTLDRLTDDDLQILKREASAVRGHTCKVLVLERSGDRPLPTLDAIREHIRAQLDAAPRLRQRLVPTPLRVANPVWLDDPQFDIARHVTPAGTEHVGGKAELEQLVASLMASPLDRAYPLWHLDVVERYDNDAMVLIWRIHHCLADGTTCVRIGSDVLWSDDPNYQCSTPRSWIPAAAPGTVALFARGVADRTRRASRQPRRPRQPGQPRQRPPSVLASRSAVKRELSRSAALTPLSHRVGSARSVAFAVAPLDECRRAGKAIDEAITLNDVVLAVIAGAVRTWLDKGLGPIAGVRVKVPVSLHHAGEAAGIGNRDSYFFVDLPVAEADPVKRVLAINRETTERKLHHDAEILYRLGTHPFVAHWAMSPRVFTFNVSNVRGPASDIYVLGARVRELYSLAEVAQRHALRMAVISTAGFLSFGLCADCDAVKDLPALADGLRHATEELLSCG